MLHMSSELFVNKNPLHSDAFYSLRSFKWYIQITLCKPLTSQHTSNDTFDDLENDRVSVLRLTIY